MEFQIKATGKGKDVIFSEDDWCEFNPDNVLPENEWDAFIEHVNETIDKELESVDEITISWEIDSPYESSSFDGIRDEFWYVDQIINIEK